MLEYDKRLNSVLLFGVEGINLFGFRSEGSDVDSLRWVGIVVANCI